MVCVAEELKDVPVGTATFGNTGGSMTVVVHAANISIIPLI